MKIDDFQKSSAFESGEIPREVARALMPISNQVEQLTSALQGRIGISENTNAEVRVVQLVHDTSSVILQHRVKGQAKAVLLAWEELFDYTQCTWQAIDDNRVRVKVKWASAPTGPTWVHLLIFGA